MLRRLLLLLAVCGAAAVQAEPRIELTATLAWGGWARPGRPSELDLRVVTDRATRATLAVESGRHTVHAGLELQPGRPLTLHLPLAPAEHVQLTLAPQDGALLQRALAIAHSELPLLGVLQADGSAIELPGFHSVALTPEALPRQVAAYAGMDALVVDATTLAALEPAQLGALLGHIAGCGRVAVVDADPNLRRLLDGAGGCGGRVLLHAASAAGAAEALAASLDIPLPTPMSAAAVGELAASDTTAWQRVTAALAVYLALAVLLALLVGTWPAVVGAGATGALAAWGLPQLLAPQAQLLVWGEADSGARLASHHALQRVVGSARDRVTMTIPPLLAPSVRACDAQQTMHLRFDPASGLVTRAEFDIRLFARATLCYAGSFPVARTLSVETQPDGAHLLQNRGGSAWPAGWLIAGGRAHELPALAAGARAPVGQPARVADTRMGLDAPLRMAFMRLSPAAVAALWPLDLAGVGGVPAATQGWLLVSVPSP